LWIGIEVLYALARRCVEYTILHGQKWVQGVSVPGPTSVSTKRFIDHHKSILKGRCIVYPAVKCVRVINSNDVRWLVPTRLFIISRNEYQRLHAKVIKIASSQSPDRLSCTSRRSFTYFDLNNPCLILQFVNDTRSEIHIGNYLYRISIVYSVYRTRISTIQHDPEKECNFSKRVYSRTRTRTELSVA